MERKGVLSAVIMILAGISLAVANPIFGAEQDTVKADNKVNQVVKSDGAATDRAKAGAAGKRIGQAEKGVKAEQKGAEESISIDLRIPFFSPLFTDTSLASV